MGLVHDEEAYLERLSTYRVETWFAKPESLTPAVCASFGWNNVAPDRLQCGTCRATLNYASSANLLERDRHETVEAFLQSLEWEHDADCVWCEDHCPSSFRQIALNDPRELFQKLRTRFLRLSVMWDLPRLDLSPMCPADTAQLRALAAKLHQEWSQDVISSSGLDVTAKGWKTRSNVLAVLALLGWDLKVLDSPLIYTQREGSAFGISHVQNAVHPESAGYCLGRQSVLTCERCAAVIGLWSCQTHPEIAIEPFKQLCAMRLQSGLHVVVDAESGEVEDLFQKPYSSTDIIQIHQNAIPSTQEEQNPRAEVAPRRTSSLELDVVKRPVFGLQCLKKKSFQQEPLQEPAHELSIEEDVKTGSVLSPVEQHRGFCCYRTQWRDILKTVLQNPTEHV